MKSWEELSRHEQLQSIHWDIYKDVHGVRPRHVIYEAMSEQDLQDAIHDLELALGFAAEQQREAEERATHDFEIRIQMLMDCGAKDREMAIRWIAESFGVDMSTSDPFNDLDLICYKLGLPYGYLDPTPVS